MAFGGPEWLSRSCLKTTFPYRVRTKKRELPGNVEEISGTCPGNFREVSGKFPGNVQEISGKFPGNFREISRTFPGQFLVISGKIPGNVREVSGNFPVIPFFCPDTVATPSVCFDQLVAFGGPERPSRSCLNATFR